MNEESNQLPVETPIKTTDPAEPPKKVAPKQKNSVFSTIAVIVSAFAVALVLVTYVFHSYQVDGNSMAPSLQHNDRLIVWKVPRTLARITGNPYIPGRGDIVIFNESGLSGYGQSSDTKQLIKRVVGLPGERVVVDNGSLTVYNSDYPNGFQPDKTLAYGTAIGETHNDVDVTVGKDQVFVAGDNRDNSLDSRFFGPINADQIVGKLVLRVLPLGDLTKY